MHWGTLRATKTCLPFRHSLFLLSFLATGIDVSSYISIPLWVGGERVESVASSPLTRGGRISSFISASFEILWPVFILKCIKKITATKTASYSPIYPLLTSCNWSQFSSLILLFTVFIFLHGFIFKDIWSCCSCGFLSTFFFCWIYSIYINIYMMSGYLVLICYFFCCFFPPQKPWNSYRKEILRLKHFCA